MTDTQDTRPWYRQFWPWFIAFPPAAAVVAGLITAYLAGTGPSMEVEDYGQIGKVTAQRAFRDERAAELGLSATVAMGASDEGGEAVVSVDLSRRDLSAAYPRAVMLRIVHPTRDEQDAEVILAGSAGRYVGRIQRPIGRLYIHVGDVERTWRLVGELLAGSGELELTAKVPGPGAGGT